MDIIFERRTRNNYDDNSSHCGDDDDELKLCMSKRSPYLNPDTAILMMQPFVYPVSRGISKQKPITPSLTKLLVVISILVLPRMHDISYKYSSNVK